MQDPYASIRNILLAAPGVAALVADRVRSWPAGQSLTTPCVLIHTVALARIPTMDGSPTYDEALVQIDCLGRTRPEMFAVASAVSAALVDYSDASIQRVLFQSYSEQVDDVAGVYRGLMEIRVFYRS